MAAVNVFGRQNKNGLPVSDNLRRPIVAELKSHASFAYVTRAYLFSICQSSLPEGVSENALSDLVMFCVKVQLSDLVWHKVVHHEITAIVVVYWDSLYVPIAYLQFFC